MRYDYRERRIWCADCEKNIEAFDAFEMLVTYFSETERKLDRRAEQLAEAEKFQTRTLAARQIGPN